VAGRRQGRGRHRLLLGTGGDPFCLPATWGPAAAAAGRPWGAAATGRARVAAAASMPRGAPTPAAGKCGSGQGVRAGSAKGAGDASPMDGVVMEETMTMHAFKG
jgi:hypothetical protein